MNDFYIKRNDNGTYTVSTQDCSKQWTVDLEADTCTCYDGANGWDCPHKAVARQEQEAERQAA